MWASDHGRAARGTPGGRVTLEQRLWNALTVMQLLSNGTTQRFDGDRVTGSKDRPLLPAGERRPEFLEFQARFARARSYSSRLAIVEEAERVLDEWRKRKPMDNPERGSYWWKKEIANSDRTGAELARLYGISRQTVQAYRRKYRDCEAA